MKDEYLKLLEKVQNRKLFIRDASLEDEKLNYEWGELVLLEGALLRLLKLSS